MHFMKALPISDQNMQFLLPCLNLLLPVVDPGLKLRGGGGGGGGGRGGGGRGLKA